MDYDNFQSSVKLKSQKVTGDLKASSIFRSLDRNHTK